VAYLYQYVPDGTDGNPEPEPEPGRCAYCDCLDPAHWDGCPSLRLGSGMSQRWTHRQERFDLARILRAWRSVNPDGLGSILAEAEADALGWD